MSTNSPNNQIQQDLPQNGQQAMWIVIVLVTGFIVLGCYLSIRDSCFNRSNQSLIQRRTRSQQEIIEQLPKYTAREPPPVYELEFIVSLPPPVYTRYT